jgi:3-dehydroquinate dehydratase-2
MKILLLNGPNLNFLGKREPAIYGTTTLEQIVESVKGKAEKMQIALDAYQSNVEGELVNAILAAHNKYDGLIINAAAFTHTSVALRDALQAVELPAIEVHLSNIFAREDFRHTSFITPVCIGQITGFGEDSYLLALEAMKHYIEEKQRKNPNKR